MAYADYVPVTGTILNITRGNDCCTQMISVRAGNGIVNFTVGPQTRVLDGRQLRTGMQVAAFYDRSVPVPMIFPPQYRAEIVAALNRNEQVMLGFFDRNLVEQDGRLQLNVADSTRVKTINGQNVTCNLGRQNLLVFYSTTTRSIPPQTTPRKIVVLC